MSRWSGLPDALDPQIRQLVIQLRRLKDHSGLSLTALASKTAYSKSSWERYLNGRNLPPRHAAEQLARIAGMDPTRLLALHEVAELVWQSAPGEEPAEELAEEAGEAVAADQAAGLRRWLRRSRLTVLVLVLAGTAAMSTPDRGRSAAAAAPSPEGALLAEGMRALRSRTGLSMAGLAAATAYSKSSWERYLNGKKMPPRQAVEALCALAKEPPGRLLALWELADSAWSGRAGRVGARRPAAATAAPGPVGGGPSSARWGLRRLALYAGCAGALAIAVRLAVAVRHHSADEPGTDVRLVSRPLRD